MSGHTLQYGIMLTHGLTKSLFCLCLCLNEEFHQTLQVGLLRSRLGRSEMGSLILKSKRVRVILWLMVRERIGIFVKEFGRFLNPKF